MYQNVSLKKEISRKVFVIADSLLDKIFLVHVWSSQILVLDGAETGILLLDFAQQLRRKNADISDIYFFLVGAAGYS